MINLTDYGANAHFLTEAALFPELKLTRVITQYKNSYKIITKDGERFAEISGNLRRGISELSDFPAVGDFVMADFAKGDSGNAVIQKVLTRKSVFKRSSVGNKFNSQVIAANIDIVFICMALNENYNLSRLERYLTEAWNSGAVPVVILTKTDLCADFAEFIAETETAAPGTDIIATTVSDEASYKKLFPYLKKGITVSFIGSSGVGKSTLINKLIGEERLKTSETGRDGKGKHTTVCREMFVLPDGGLVIDTPGMREFGLETANFSKSFSDIEELAGKCRFNDCRHINEPGCAVLEAVNEGKLDLRRLNSYRKLIKESTYNGLDSRQLENKKLNNMFGAFGGMKKIRKYIRENDKRKGE